MSSPFEARTGFMCCPKVALYAEGTLMIRKSIFVMDCWGFHLAMIDRIMTPSTSIISLVKPIREESSLHNRSKEMPILENAS